MARDDTARDTDSEQSLLDRRSHLRLADAAAETVAESGTVSAGASADDGTSVPADETERLSHDDSEHVEVGDGS